MRNSTVKSVVFLSNYISHHQKPFSEAMFNLLGKGYLFIETKALSDERKKLGWQSEHTLPFLVPYESFEQNKAHWQSVIDAADVVIFGSAPFDLLKNRIKQKKLIFRYMERPLKDNTKKWKYPFRLITWRRHHPQGKNIYLLCASAYTSADFAKFGLYRKKCYKWGYFPPIKYYDDIDRLIHKKQPASILWVARFLDWKHPESAVEIARRLKEDGYRFEMNLIGSGELEDSIRASVEAKALTDCVHLLGSMPPESVREHMEQSEIFLFTSDRNEGWGAVLNESMNSACAVVASHAIGSVPFLMENGENGLIYRDGDLDDLYQKVKHLLDHTQERRQMAKSAYFTIVAEWNAENAAQRFSSFAQKILNGEKTIVPQKSGICSPAKCLNDNWIKKQ